MQEDSLEGLEIAARQRSAALAPSAIQVCDDLILTINQGTRILTGTEHDRALNFLSGVLLAQAFNSLWRAREDAVSGYAPQSMALTRVALEQSVTLRWLRRNPEQVDRWLWTFFPEVERPDGPIPSIDTMAKNDPDLSEFTKTAYDQLSKFAHPRGKGLRWVVHVEGDSTSFHYGAFVDEADLRAALFYLVTTAITLLEEVQHLQMRALGATDAVKSFAGTLPPLIERARAFLDEVEASVADPDMAHEE